MAKNSRNSGSGDLPFAKELFEAADRMRGSVESAEYKHLVLVMKGSAVRIRASALSCGDGFARPSSPGVQPGGDERYADL